MKTVREIIYHIQAIFLMSVGLMGVKDSFDPSTYGFWSSISSAVITNLLITWFSKKYQKDSFKYVDKPVPRMLMTMQSIIFFAVAFMLFLPFGTFNPTMPGFYYCVALGILFGIGLQLLFQKSVPPTAMN